MTFLLGLAIGLVLGAAIGVVIMSWFVVASDADRMVEHLPEWEKDQHAWNEERRK
jgi:ABC-type nitrate/sulfonate/bicarbonate transport system permease component